MAPNLRAVLDLARWAPSGDNTQPWRFEIVGPEHVVVHGFDTREHCVYDLDGRPSQISLGALLETVAIAASGQGLTVSVRRRVDLADHRPTFDLRFQEALGQAPDPLLGFVRKRAVQRRAMAWADLDDFRRHALEGVLEGSGFHVRWYSSWAQRQRMAWLMFCNAKLRLTMPEAYAVHRDVIEWNARFSQDRIPDMSLGADAMTVRMMRFAMHSWNRVDFFNRFLMGSVVPRLQMDLWPGLACAAHFALVAASRPDSVDDFVRVGRVVQRFWLTATSLGLVSQPEMTPLIFASYVRRGVPFTRDASACERARKLTEHTDSVLGPEAERVVWLGRLGTGPQPVSRSERKPLDALLTTTVEGAAG